MEANLEKLLYRMLAQAPEIDVYLPRLLSAFLILAVTLVMARLSRRMMERLEEDVIKKTKIKIDDLIFGHASKGAIYVIYAVGAILASVVLRLEILIRPIMFVLILALINPVANIVKAIVESTMGEFVKRAKTRIEEIVPPISKGAVYITYAVGAILASVVLRLEILIRPIMFVLILALINPVANIVSATVESTMGEFARHTETKTDDMVVSIIKKTVRSSVYLLGGIVALDQLGIKVVPLVAGMGIAGLAIGLAAKDTLSNMIAGIFIIVDRPFVVGDRIEIWHAPKDSSTWGDVTQIGLRSTKIRTTDNLIVVVPNSEIALRDVINYTAVSPTIRVGVSVGIAYESDFKKALKIMEKAAKGTKGVLASPPPVSYFMDYGESSQNLEVKFWIEDARNRHGVRSEVITKIKEEFDREGIEIPYPRRRIIMDKGGK